MNHTSAFPQEECAVRDTVCDVAPSSRRDFHPPALIRGVQPLSMCDWPGRMALVLFLGGCDLRCPTCHNATLAWRPQTLPPVVWENLRAQLQLRRQWYDGIVVSGGEPTIHSTLPQLLRALRAFDLPLRLDTNGMRPDVTASLLKNGLIDAVAMDIKGPFDLYPQLTGGMVEAREAEIRLTAHLELARLHPGVFQFRLTQVPLLTEADMATARSYLPEGHTLTLQPYVPPKE